jgi:hypothetical protein
MRFEVVQRERHNNRILSRYYRLCGGTVSTKSRKSNYIVRTPRYVKIINYGDC